MITANGSRQTKASVQRRPANVRAGISSSSILTSTQDVAQRNTTNRAMRTDAIRELRSFDLIANGLKRAASGHARKGERQLGSSGLCGRPLARASCRQCPAPPDHSARGPLEPW